MKIVPISALSDNYIWLVHDEESAVCVDPGDAAPVLALLQQKQLDLDAIILTHHHNDHIGGVADLQAAYPDVAVYGPEDIACVNQALKEGQELNLLGQVWRVWFVPGHTHNHLAYILRIEGKNRLHVFCGDTLFSAGCGRVFTGTIEQLEQSLQRFAGLPKDTLFYPTHEYTASNLRFALSVEPDNEAAKLALEAAAKIPTLPVNLSHEKAVNPFLRTDTAEIIASVAAKNLPHANASEVFASLREMKNQF